MIQVVGYLGSTGAALMWIPQVISALRHRGSSAALAGISPATYLSAIAFNALLVAYGLLSHAQPVVLAGCINFACATVIETVVLLARRSTR